MNQWFNIVLIGFFIGVFFRSLFSVNIFISLFVLLLSLVILLLARVDLSTNKKALAYASAFLLALSLGMIRFTIADVVVPQLPPSGERVHFRGLVIDEPDIREDHQNLTIQIRSVESGKNLISGNVLAIVDRYSEYQYGDELDVSGVIKLPKNISNSKSDSNDNSFDYVSYLAKDGIYYQMFRPQMTLTASGKGNPIKSALFAIKHAFLTNINRSIVEPESSLLAGLVVGAKQSLGKKLLDDFRMVGVIHIVVLSGYNLTIVAQAMMRSFSFLPQVASRVLGGVGIILFALMTGASATIVRASIMALLVLLAQGFNRDYDITRALLLAGFVMILQNPHILVFDPSFQLSFLATMALIFLEPKTRRFVSWVPKRFGLQELASATLATQLFVLPFLLYSMGTLSLVALPVNLLILPLIPVTMLFGFVVGMLGFISWFAAFPFALAAHFLLAYELKVVELFAGLPFAAISINYFPFWLAALIYVGFGCYSLLRSSNTKAASS